ncbi:MAG: response regulator, partial [Planctomycetota bacterium]|nr:response regulator [Planctomycetota bacterium]
MSILVVEDTAEIRENLGLILRLEGFDVCEAADGIEALEKIHAEPPQLILTDLEMPHLDGFGFLEALRGDLLLHRIPVIVVTAHEGRSHVRKAMRLGANDFIAKPWDNADLLKTIRNLLDESDRGDAVVDRDQVTGLFHRSAAIEVLPGLLARGGVGENVVITGAAVSGFLRFRALFGVDECHRCLKAVGERIRELAMDDSHCAYLGNGLFMWVGLPAEKDLSDFLFEAKRRLEEPVDLQNGSYQPSFLLVGLPQSSTEIVSQEPAVLVEGLELALQNAQAEGVTDPVILDRGGEGVVSERLLDIPPRLRKSLREHPEEFSVAWQPQMTLTDGTCSGAEALLRWVCPDRGPVSPGVFIPMAESWG